MKVVALIAARGGSRGLPRKNLRLLHGKPLIEWTINAAIMSKSVNATFVSTEDDEISAISKKAGAILLKRPKCLAGDTSQMSEVYRFVLRQITEDTQMSPEIAVILTPTCPLRTWRDIDGAVELYLRYKEGSVFAGSINHRFHWQAAENTTEGEYEPVGIGPEKRQGRQYYKDTDWLVEESGAIYVVGVKKYLTEGDFRLYPFHVYLMPKERSIDIDSTEDIDLAAAHLKKQDKSFLLDNGQFIGEISAE